MTFCGSLTAGDTFFSVCSANSNVTAGVGLKGDPGNKGGVRRGFDLSQNPSEDSGPSLRSSPGKWM